MLSQPFVKMVMRMINMRRWLQLVQMDTATTTAAVIKWLEQFWQCTQWVPSTKAYKKCTKNMGNNRQKQFNLAQQMLSYIFRVVMVFSCSYLRIQCLLSSLKKNLKCYVDCKSVDIETYLDQWPSFGLRIKKVIWLF